MERIQRKASAEIENVQAKAGKAGAGDTGGGGPSDLPPIQRKAAPQVGPWGADDSLMSAMGLQMKGGGGGDVHAAAAHGVSGPSTSMPHAAAIQQSFGSAHDVSSISAHVGGPAAEACADMGASAYASGNSVAFGSSPDLHTAAHEAAHVVQQKAGVSLYGGVGQSGDVYERHADAVADRVVAGESAADLLAAGPSGGGNHGAVQKKEPVGEEPPATDKGGDAQAGGGGAQPANFTTMKLKAKYEEIPGASKTGPKRADQNDALWLDPLTINPMSPPADEVHLAKGVTMGGGQLVETFKAPIADGEGSGMIQAQLRYASDVKKSYKVKIDGVKKADRSKAESAAKTFVAEKIAVLGDVDQIEAKAKEQLEKDFPGITVKIIPEDDKKILTDAGRSSFYYKARANPTILMDAQVVPVAAKQIDSHGSTTKNEGSSTDKTTHDNTQTDKVDIKDRKEQHERHGEAKVEVETKEYNEAVTKTVDEYVSALKEAHAETKGKVITTATSEDKYSDKDTIEQTYTEKKWRDYTKDVNNRKEDGEENKKNWAAWLQDGVNFLDELVDPLKFLPISKKWRRRLKGWGIATEIIDKGAGLFAERGKVKYQDDKTHTEEHDKSGTEGGSKTTRDRNVTLEKESEIKTTLEQSWDSTVKEKWERHLKQIETKKATYVGTKTSVSGGGSDANQSHDHTYDRNSGQQGETKNEKQNQSVTTTIDYKVSATETYTKPLFTASVVDGDGEVSANPFSPKKP